MTAHEQTEDTALIWRKASRSTAGNDCVEVTKSTGQYLIRDSKIPAGPRLSIGERTWTALVDDIKAGKYML